MHGTFFSDLISRASGNPGIKINRDVEIVKFYTCPGTSKWSLCTCPKKVLLAPNKRLARAHPAISHCGHLLLKM